MTSAITHFKIHGDNPAKLADFYRRLLGWQLNKTPGVECWQVDTGAVDGQHLHCGVTDQPVTALASRLALLHAWRIIQRRYGSTTLGTRRLFLAAVTVTVAITAIATPSLLAKNTRSTQTWFACARSYADGGTGAAARDSPKAKMPTDTIKSTDAVRRRMMRRMRELHLVCPTSHNEN